MRFTVAGDHPALDGHFPGRPVVPGVLLLEYVLDAIEAGQALPASLRLPWVKFARSLLPGRRKSWPPSLMSASAERSQTSSPMSMRTSCAR